jgi:hypothetical protein
VQHCRLRLRDIAWVAVLNFFRYIVLQYQVLYISTQDYTPDSGLRRVSAYWVWDIQNSGLTQTFRSSLLGIRVTLVRTAAYRSNTRIQDISIHSRFHLHNFMPSLYELRFDVIERFIFRAKCVSSTMRLIAVVCHLSTLCKQTHPNSCLLNHIKY